MLQEYTTQTRNVMVHEHKHSFGGSTVNGPLATDHINWRHVFFCSAVNQSN